MSTAPLITEADRATLSRLLALRRSTHQDVRALVDLSDRLKRSVVVRPGDLDASVVTLGSTVRIRTVGPGDERVLTIVVPTLADSGSGQLSVLTPVGMALLGRRAGDTVEVAVPSGRTRFRIAEVLFQPEAAEGVAAVA